MRPIHPGFVHPHVRGEAKEKLIILSFCTQNEAIANSSCFITYWLFRAAYNGLHDASPSVGSYNAQN